MIKNWVGFVCLGVTLSANGCGAPSPSPSPGGQTCSQLGWACGTDDLGRSCGSCSAPLTCNGAGRCTGGSPTCNCDGLSCGPNSCGTGSCGTCNSGQSCAAGVCTTPTPTTHDLGSGTAPLFSNFYGFPFSVPASSIVAYSVTSGTTGDTFDVGIFSAADWAVYMGGGAGARAYAVHGMTSIVTDSATIPAGSYYLGFRCRNLVQRCQVSYAINARY